jgi:hypothetical protein
LSPDLSSQVLLPSGIACVNQYTGKVLGERVRGQTFLGYVLSNLPGTQEKGPVPKNGAFSKIIPAATYVPTQLPVQYHRPGEA